MGPLGLGPPSTETLALRTTAVRSADGSSYTVRGQKVWTSRAEHSDLLLLLARTAPRSPDPNQRTAGLSVFLVDMYDALRSGRMTIRPIRTMINHSTTEIFFDDLVIPASALVGEEGKGFRYILEGMNAERILIAAECIGDARFFLDNVRDRKDERENHSHWMLTMDHAWLPFSLHRPRRTRPAARCLGARLARTRACSFRWRRRTPPRKPRR